MYYKNLSNATKTFYGVEFKPGEIHNVNGYINHDRFIVVDEKDIKNEPKIEPVKSTKAAKSTQTNTKKVESAKTETVNKSSDSADK